MSAPRSIAMVSLLWPSGGLRPRPRRRSGTSCRSLAWVCLLFWGGLGVLYWRALSFHGMDVIVGPRLGRGQVAGEERGATLRVPWVKLCLHDEEAVHGLDPVAAPEPVCPLPAGAGLRAVSSSLRDVFLPGLDVHGQVHGSPGVNPVGERVMLCRRMFQEVRRRRPLRSSGGTSSRAWGWRGNTFLHQRPQPFHWNREGMSGKMKRGPTVG